MSVFTTQVGQTPFRYCITPNPERPDVPRHVNTSPSLMSEHDFETRY
jgi:hypothetical protein